MHRTGLVVAVNLAWGILPGLAGAQEPKPAAPQETKPEAARDAEPNAKRDTPEEAKPPSKPTVIDGRVHPELIPDATAYRIVFTHLISHVGDPEREKVWFGVPGLSADDQEVLLRILTSYKKEWDEIVKAYNDAGEAAARKGKAPEPSVLETFRTRQAELVKQTRLDLGAGLSPAGALMFHGYVEQQKSHMTVTLEPGEETPQPPTGPDASSSIGITRRVDVALAFMPACFPYNHKSTIIYR